MEKNKIMQIIIALFIILVPVLFSGKFIGFPDYWETLDRGVLLMGRFFCTTIGLYLIYRIFEKADKI